MSPRRRRRRTRRRKFVFTGTRQTDAEGAIADASVQLSEVVLYGTDGAPLAVSGASNPGGSNPGGQEASSAIDGEDGTKWCVPFARAPLPPPPPAHPPPPPRPLP